MALAVSRKSKKSKKRRQAKKIVARTKPQKIRKVRPPKLTKAKRVKRSTRVTKKLKRIKAPIVRIKRPKLIKPKKGKQRDLRAAWNYLRRLGLISSKRDARKIKKTDKRAMRQVKEYEDVLSGRAQVHEVSPTDARSYRRAGYKTTKNRLVLPKEKGTTQKKKGRLIHTRRKVAGGEIITVLTPYSYADLQRGLQRLDNDKEVQDLIEQGWRFAFKFFGNFSYATFPTVALMQEYLAHYSGLEEGKIIRNLELIIVLVGTSFNRPQAKRVRRNRKREPYKPNAFQRMKRRPASYARFKANVRASMKRYRAKLSSQRKKGKRHAKTSKTTPRSR